VATLQAQVEGLREEKQRIEKDKEDEVRQLQEHLRDMGDSAGAAFYYGNAAHAEDILKLRSQVSELERELLEVQSSYDRDKALWEGKCQFLEQQKDTYKRDLIES